MSDNIEPCTVGILLNKALDCHKLSYCRKSLLIILSEVPDLELKLIQKRADVAVSAADTICSHHAKIYLEKFEEHQRKCCDPFSMHNRVVKSKLIPVRLQMEWLRKLANVFIERLFPAGNFVHGV